MEDHLQRRTLAPSGSLAESQQDTDPSRVGIVRRPAHGMNTDTMATPHHLPSPAHVTRADCLG